jgi:uncharacterized protein YciI
MEGRVSMERPGEDVRHGHGSTRDGGGGERTSYFYLMTDAHELIREVAPDHAEYWQSLGLSGYLGGPFSDRSGGLITFDAIPDEEAERLVDQDPFVRKGLIGASWTKRWAVEPL